VPRGVKGLKSFNTYGNVCVHTYIYIDTLTSICIYTNTYFCNSMNPGKWRPRGNYVYVYVYVYVNMYRCIDIHTCTCTYTNVYLCNTTYTNVHLCTNTNVYLCNTAYTNVYLYKCIPLQIYTYTNRRGKGSVAPGDSARVLIYTGALWHSIARRVFVRCVATHCNNSIWIQILRTRIVTTCRVLYQSDSPGRT